MPLTWGIRRFSMPAGILQAAKFFINFHSSPSLLLARRKPHAGIGVSKEADVARQVALRSTPDFVKCTPQKLAREDALMLTQTESLGQHGGTKKRQRRPDAGRGRFRPPIHATWQRDDLKGPATDDHRLRHERNATRCNPQGTPQSAIVTGPVPSGRKVQPTGKWRLRRLQRTCSRAIMRTTCPAMEAVGDGYATPASTGPCFARCRSHEVRPSRLRELRRIAGGIRLFSVGDGLRGSLDLIGHDVARNDCPEPGHPPSGPGGRMNRGMCMQ